MIGAPKSKGVLRVLVAMAVTIGLAIWCGDRVGFDGDDLAIMEGATHFDLKPLDTLYRYAWQPLSFFIAHRLTQNGLVPLSLTYLSGILGGIGLVVLAETVRAILRTSNRTWIAYALVLAIPELWITILYFNTTALGLPFFCATLLLLCRDVRNEPVWIRDVAVAAVSYAIACLLRFDFAAVSLALLVLVYCQTPSRKWLGVLVFMMTSASSGLALMTFLGVSLLDSLGTAFGLETHPLPAWRSAVTFLLSVLPLILISPVLLREVMRRTLPSLPLTFWAVVAISAVPMLYPLKSLYSGKYLIPAFCMALVGLAFLLRQPLARTVVAPTMASPCNAPSNFTSVNVCIVAITLLACYVLGLQVDKRTWRVAGVGWSASTFVTDDGVRPLGAYLSLIGTIRDPKRRPRNVLLNHAIASWLMRSPGDAVVIEVDDYDGQNKEWDAPLVSNWTWGWPSLYLQSKGWTLDHYVLKRRISLHAPDGRKAHVITSQEAEADLPSHECMLEIGPVRATEDVDGENDLERYARIIFGAPCNP